jgi:hypothetical protein
VDTDVAPEEALVLLDGERVGTADAFDGFPDYLLLEPGTHTIEFVHPGYRTLRITLHARCGAFHPIDRHLSHGAGTDVGEGSPGRPDPLFGDLGHADCEHHQPPPPEEGSGEGPAPRADPGDLDRPDPEEEPAAPPSDEPAGLLLDVRPADAAIYLDGKLLAAGEGEGRMERGEIVPGRHVLEVVMPGYETYRSTLVLAPGERRQVSVRLLRAKSPPEP